MNKTIVGFTGDGSTRSLQMPEGRFVHPALKHAEVDDTFSSRLLAPSINPTGEFTLNDNR